MDCIHGTNSTMCVACNDEEKMQLSTPIRHCKCGLSVLNENRTLCVVCMREIKKGDKGEQDN